MSGALTLRDYQTEALARVGAAAARGVRRQLGVAATGLGKTVMFCALAREMGVRTLVVAHRDELIEQAAAKVREVWPGVDVGIVKGSRNEVHAQVVVASIQTLARPTRLAAITAPTELFAIAPFGLVVIDEAHHSAAPSYRAVMDALRCGQDDGPLLLGVTATPDRGDGKGLDDLFDEVTFAYDLRWGIAREYLSDLRGIRVSLAADLSKLKVNRGDYDMGQAGQMLEDANAPDLIARAWLAHAKGRRTLVFTPTVATAQAVAAEFVGRGVRAGSVDGAMDMDDRRGILAAYSRGDLDVLVNCMVLTEGYDEPRTDCIIVARPTKSRALYTQMVGRGTRIHPDKSDCLVIDVVGVTDVHDLVTIPSLFGIEKPGKMWDEGMTATGALREQIEEHAAQGRLIAAEARLFDKVRQGRIAWVRVNRLGEPSRYEVDLGNHRYLVLRQLSDTEWRAGVSEYGVKRVLLDGTMEMAQGVAEDYARKRGAGGLVNTDAKWRTRRPSAKQLALAAKMHIDVPTGATKGDVNDLISAALARKRNRKVSK